MPAAAAPSTVMAMGLAGLALGGRAEHRDDVIVALHVRLLGEIEVAPVGLRFAGEGSLQILLGLRPFNPDFLSMSSTGLEGFHRLA